MKEQQQVHKIDIGISDSDSDSDYGIDEEMDLDNESDDDNLDDYFLSDDHSQRYGVPPMATFSKDLMVTGTSVLRWLPLGAIRQQKKKTTQHCKSVHFPSARASVVRRSRSPYIYIPFTIKSNQNFPIH